MEAGAPQDGTIETNTLTSSSMPEYNLDKAKGKYRQLHTLSYHLSRPYSDRGNTWLLTTHMFWIYHKCFGFSLLCLASRLPLLQFH